jgi:hypothetical protein
VVGAGRTNADAHSRPAACSGVYDVPRWHDTHRGEAAACSCAALRLRARWRRSRRPAYWPQAAARPQGYHKTRWPFWRVASAGAALTRGGATRLRRRAAGALLRLGARLYELSPTTSAVDASGGRYAMCCAPQRPLSSAWVRHGLRRQWRAGGRPPRHLKNAKRQTPRQCRNAAHLGGAVLLHLRTSCSWLAPLKGSCRGNKRGTASTARTPCQRHHHTTWSHSQHTTRRVAKRTCCTALAAVGGHEGAFHRARREGLPVR